LTALRTVTRLKKDWITTGRRPDSICAAALLIASRAHGFETHQNDIASLFRVSNETLKSRLIEFRATPAAHQTVTQFNGMEPSSGQIYLENDPPSFIRNLKKLDEENNNEAFQYKSINFCYGFYLD
jgi:transcription factor IIIB subunit 2